MKHYIFLTSGILDMGGAEMFTANKCKYLKSIGWDVRVYYYRNTGDLRIPELGEFRNNNIPELLYGITYIPKRKREKIIDLICHDIDINDETVIESHLLNLAYWGELIAKTIHGKSIINAMEENFNTISRKEADFIKFKMKRMEILNAGPRTLRRYLSNYYKEEYNIFTHKYMIPFCSNVVASEDTSINLPDSGQNILSVGRLDKPYVIPMFKEIKKFVIDNPDKKYNLLVVGGSPKGKVEKMIAQEFSTVENITLYTYGYVFPIPCNLITKADVGIATANSVLVISNQGIPTIAIDIHDLRPIGIFEYTTTNRFSRTHEPIESVYRLLDEVLNDKKYTRKNPKFINEIDEINHVFSRQIKFLSVSASDHNYYNVESIYPRYKYFKNQLKKLIFDFQHLH